MATYPGGGTGGFGGGPSLGGRSLYQFKQAFFDAAAVLNAMDKATHKALSKAGAFIRQRAKTSIRYRKEASSPGSPPSAHKSAMSGIRKGNTLKKQQPTSPLRDFLFFAYDKATRSVIIGPAKTNQANAVGMGGLTIPQVLEYGGRVTIHEHLVPGRTVKAGTRGRDGKYQPAGYRSPRWVRTDLRYRLSEGGPRSAVGRQRRQRLATYPARPFMAPALAAEAPRVAQMFRNSMR